MRVPGAQPWLGPAGSGGAWFCQVWGSFSGLLKDIPALRGLIKRIKKDSTHVDPDGIKGKGFGLKEESLD